MMRKNSIQNTTESTEAVYALGAYLCHQTTLAPARACQNQDKRGEGWLIKEEPVDAMRLFDLIRLH